MLSTIHVTEHRMRQIRLSLTPVLWALLMLSQPPASLASPPPGHQPFITARLDSLFELQETLASRQSVSHTLSIAEFGEYLLEVQAENLDVNVTVEAQSGLLITVNQPLFRDESERIALALPPGSLTVTIESTEFTGTDSLYAVRLFRFNTADAQHRKLFEVSRDLTAADSDKASDSDAAPVDYRSVAERFRVLGESRLQARAVFSTAMRQYWTDYNFSGAAHTASKAAQLYADIGNQQLRANALQLEAAALIETAHEDAEKTRSSPLVDDNSATSNFERALELFKSAEEIHRALGDSVNAAQVLNNIGLTYHYMSRWTQAAQYYTTAARELKDHKEWSLELNPRANLGVILFEHGEFRQAIAELSRLLTVLPKTEETGFRADTLDNMAAASLELNEYDDALDYFARALTLHRTLDDLKGIGRSLAGIGTTYALSGRHSLAARHLQQALTAREQANDVRGQLSSLRHLSQLQRQSGQYPAEQKLLQRALLLATSPKDRALLNRSMANSYLIQGHVERAKNNLAAALDNARHIESPLLQADLDVLQGRVLAADNQANAAIEHLHAALERYNTLHLEDRAITPLSELALIHSARGEHAVSVQFAQRAVKLADQLRYRLANPRARGYVLQQHHAHYETAIRVLVAAADAQSNASRAAQYIATALAYGERTRARALADTLQISAHATSRLSTRSLDAKTRPETRTSDSFIDPHGDLDGTQVASLPVKRRELLDRMTTLRYQLESRAEQADPPLVWHPESGDSLARELSETETQLHLIDRLLADADRTTGSESVLTTSQLDAPAIQNMLSNKDTLLQYFVGEHGSFVWVVTSDTLDIHRIPDRQSLEEQVRLANQELRTVGADRKGGSTALTNLSDDILPGMTIESLRENVIIVADGPLQYLPFSAVEVNSKTGDRVRLIKRRTPSVVPSLSSLRIQRLMAAKRTTPSKALAVFADPVFETSDPRVSVEKEALPVTTPIRTARPPWRSALNQNLQTDGLPRLPYSSLEAEQIAALVDASSRRLALGFDATRALALDGSLRDFRYIHFATHARVDSAFPALSALTLSTLDPSGTPVPGDLRLDDLQRLSINADLVVLSACDTAVGPEIRGEGVNSLTQGFMAAGARGVIASHWAVPDRATSELMTRFYTLMIKHNQPAPLALRNAQLELASQARFESPFYWAAYSYFGDWASGPEQTGP